jgi:hypothetical protein
MTNEALDQLERERAAAADVAFNAIRNLEVELDVARSAIQATEDGQPPIGPAIFVPAAELIHEVVRLTSAYEAIWRVTEALYEMSPEHRAFVQRMGDTDDRREGRPGDRFVWGPDDYTIGRPAAQES